MTTDTTARESALDEYLQSRLRAFVLTVASSGLQVTVDDAMRTNRAMWERDYFRQIERSDVRAEKAP